MSIFRTNNPLQYDEVDGIVIDEQAPAPQVQGVGTGVAILVGQFQRGNTNLTRVSSMQSLHEEYGKSSYLGNIQLKNKAFSVLKVIRVIAADAVKALITFESAGEVDIIRFTAKHPGLYGNKIKVTIEAGSDSGKKYTIQDTNDDAVLSSEVYDNLAIAAVAAAFAASPSKLVDVSVLATSAEPANAAATALATGTDGTLADTDYEDAIAKAAVEGAGNVLFLDEYNSTRNSYLKAHAAETQDKMVVCAGAEGESVASAVTAVATLRDTQGRIIYAYNWVGTLINGVEDYTSPAAWIASIISQTAPNVDPAYAGNTQYLFGVTSLKSLLTRDEYIQLKEAGISSFEQDLDIGFKLKSGIVTQIADSSKLTVLRRRMADYLTNSIGRFLKVYQNDVNSEPKRVAVQAAIKSFIKLQENLGILPRDKEVTGGRASLVDIKSENTNETIAAGKFIILYKQRIYSSMRFIVLKAEIGESVVVTEQE